MTRYKEKENLLNHVNLLLPIMKWWTASNISVFSSTVRIGEPFNNISKFKTSWNFLRELKSCILCLMTLLGLLCTYDQQQQKHQMNIPAKFSSNWNSCFRKKDLKKQTTQLMALLGSCFLYTVEGRVRPTVPSVLVPSHFYFLA